MEIKNLFINYLKKVELENKPQTYICYSNHLKQLLKFCNERNLIKVEDLSNSFYDEFLVYARLKKWKNRTINKRIQLFKSACINSKITFDFFDNKKLKEDFVRFHSFREDELKKLMNYIYQLSDEPVELTFKLVLLLLLDTGVRINELLHIERDNISLEDNSILLTTTKTSQERVVFFNKFTADYIKKYLDLKVNNKILLYNFRRNEPLNYRAVQCFFNKLKKELNIKLLHPHMFRHTFATNLINNDAPIYMVQLLLGHTSIRTTEIYLHLSQNKLKQTYDHYSTYHI